MSDGSDNESAAGLRAKAACFSDISKLMGEGTRARLIRMATEYLELAIKLEEEQQRQHK